VELARLERNELRRSQDLAGAALLETDRAVAFSEQARELAAEMRSADRQARLQQRLAELPGPLLRPGREATAPLSRRRASYRIPVEGRLVTGTGELSDAGVHARGLTFETAINAPVVAPRSGRIAYAGRFRSYGEIVVIDHGGGWSSTITDLAALRVRQGDLVEMGAPIGRTRGRIMVELRHYGRPASIAALIAPG
jgi:septal ring factor EnvC (AmiA/AmiB activator)